MYECLFTDDNYLIIIKNLYINKEFVYSTDSLTENDTNLKYCEYIEIYITPIYSHFR